MNLIHLIKHNLIIFAKGYLQSRAVYFLMNIHITPRAIYLTRVSIILCFLLFYFNLLFYKPVMIPLKKIFSNLYFLSESISFILSESLMIMFTYSHM